MRLAAAIVIALAGLATPTTAFAAGTSGAPVSLSIDTTEVNTRIGQYVTFHTTVRNDTDQPKPGLVAHLNVLSVDPAVYVDPEDWSSHRSVYLGTIPAHGSVTVPWTVQVVNDGHFVLYVAVTPRTGPPHVDVSGGLRLSAVARTALDAGGALPVVIGVPALLAALSLGNAARRRKLR